MLINTAWHRWAALTVDRSTIGPKLAQISRYGFTLGPCHFLPVTFASTTPTTAKVLVRDDEVARTASPVIEGLSRFTATLGATGPQRVTVLVDDPGNASRIDVVVGGGNENYTLRAVPDFPLFTVSVPAATELGPSDELALILSGHDWPMRRLAAAIKVIGESPVPRPAIRTFWMGMLVEWLRWLTPDLTLDDSHTLGAMIEERLSGVSDDSMDAVAVELAAEIVRRST